MLLWLLNSIWIALDRKRRWWWGSSNHRTEQNTIHSQQQQGKERDAKHWILFEEWRWWRDVGLIHRPQVGSSHLVSPRLVSSTSSNIAITRNTPTTASTCNDQRQRFTSYSLADCLSVRPFLLSSICLWMSAVTTATTRTSISPCDVDSYDEHDNSWLWIWSRQASMEEVAVRQVVHHIVQLYPPSPYRLWPWYVAMQHHHHHHHHHRCRQLKTIVEVQQQLQQHDGQHTTASATALKPLIMHKRTVNVNKHQHLFEQFRRWCCYKCLQCIEWKAVSNTLASTYMVMFYRSMSHRVLFLLILYDELGYTDRKMN